jgi:Flp pilus assembly pilin Flp
MLRVCVWLALVFQDGVRAVSSAASASGRASDERGQTTAEYALVILAAAAIAIVLIAWARSSGKLPAFFDHIIDQLTNSAS